ncbi:WD domain, G-beta repeat, partial [Rhizoctonia solani]
MISNLKARAKRRLGIGVRAQDTAVPELPNQTDPSISAIPTSPLPESPTTPSNNTSTVHLNNGWNISTTSLPALTLSTDKPSESSTIDDSVRPVIDNRHSTMRFKTRTEIYLWSGLKKLSSLLDSSTEAFGPLKSAIGGLKWCIDLYESTIRANSEYNELRVKLDSLLGDLSKFVDRPINPTMMSNVIYLSKRIQTELALVLQKQERGLIRRHAETLGDPDEVVRIYRRINTHLERFMFNANLSIWETIEQQSTDALIEKLSFATSAMYNSAEAIDVKRGPCTPETRQSELEQLRGWGHGGQSHNVYWLNGMAGTGKTTLAYSLCAELDQNHRLGASFFCSRTIPECRNVKYILPSIAYQLASFSPPFRYALSQTLRLDRDVHHRLLKSQFESLIVKPILAAKHTLSYDIVVVIDALDECENENSIGQILDLLLGVDLSVPIRFLISSRPEPEIYRRMMQRTGQSFEARLVLHELDQGVVKKDIKTYLIHQLNGIPLTPAQLDALVERSGILFIYAATAAAYIRAGYILMEHQERLDMILGISTPSSDGKDKYIDELYRTILSAAFNNFALDKSGRERMGTILNTVICAQEPMTTQTIAGLLKLKNREQVQALLRPLGSVIHVSERGGLVTVLHTSFSDFLLDQQRSTSFYCNPAQNHESLARVCLEAIKSNDPQFNIGGIKSSYYPDEEIADIAERVDGAITQELFYSCRNWANHVQLAEKCDELEKLVYDHLSIRLLLWMEILNLKKCIDMGVTIMYQVDGWARHVEASNQLIELTHDAWRFVTTFASHPVSRSTPHIYLSMLPFWPGDAPISLHYTPRIRHMVKPEGTALTRRQPALLATWSFRSQVTSAKFSPDGSRIVVATGKELLIIDGYTGRRLVGPLKGHTNTISSVEFSPDGLQIASSSWDGTIRIWNAQTGKMPFEPLTGHVHSVESVQFSPDGAQLVSGSWDTTLRVWDTTRGVTIMGPLQGHTAFVTSVAFSPGGDLIASGSYDKTIRIWEVEGGAMKHGPLKGHLAGITSIVFSPDGTWLASGSRDGAIRVWDVKNWLECGMSVEGATGPITAIQFSPDAQQIISASEDKLVRIYILENSNWRERITLAGHTGHVTSVMFSQDGRRIVSGSFDSSARVWDANIKHTSPWFLPPDGHRNEVNLVQYLLDDSTIVSRSIDRVARSWSSPAYEALKPHGWHINFDKEQTCMAFSNEGVVLSGSAAGAIEIISNNPTYFRVKNVDRAGVTALAWSSNGDYIASGSSGIVQLWNSRTGQEIFDQHTRSSNRVTALVFSPRDTHIAASSGMIVTIWDIKDMKANQSVLKGHTQPTTSISFSPNNKLIASGSEDTTVRVWEFQTGKIVFSPLKGHKAAVTSLDFSPDGARIASASRDMHICLWDLRSEALLFKILEGHTGAVLSIAFSHSGTHIVSGSSDTAIRIWDVRDDPLAPKSGTIQFLQPLLWEKLMN